MLTPNLPLLRCLETVSAVDRNAVLVVIAQQQVGVFARALIADAESDVRRQLIAQGNCAADATKMLACAQWNRTENTGEAAGGSEELGRSADESYAGHVVRVMVEFTPAGFRPALTVWRAVR